VTIRLTLQKTLAVLPALLALVIGVAAAPAQAQDADATDTPTITERFDDWTLSCNKTKDGKELCQIHQILTSAANNQFVAMLAIAKPNGQYTMIATVPLGSRLKDQPSLTIDNGTNKYAGEYVQCLGIGCRVRFNTNTSFLDSLGKGTNATVSIARPTGQPLGIQFSLKGFTAARRALDNKGS